MKKNLLKFILTASLCLTVVFPVLTFAQGTSLPTSLPALQLETVSGRCPSNTSIRGLICNFQSILNSIVPLLVALGVVYFVWGVVTYMIGGDDEAKKTGRDRIIFGIIGLAVIISLWGLVNIVVNTFNLGAAAPTAQINNLVVAPTGSCSNNIANGTAKVSDILNYVTCVIGSSVIPLIFAIAVVTFVWGGINFFIINADEEAKREQGKQFMLWAIVALAVMLSIWGLVHLLTNTFSIDFSLPKVKP